MATFYFSSSTGSNTTGTGTIGNPWEKFNGKKNGTNALSPGDICYFKAGDTWYNTDLVVDSNGSAGNPIIIDRYGEGADPVFSWGVVTTGWTFHATSTYSGGGSIYKKTGMIAANGAVGVDGTYGLGNWSASTGAGDPITSTYANLPKGSYKNDGVGTLYINLADGSDPAGHTITVPSRGQWDANRGIVGGSYLKGSYVDIKHITVKTTNGKGFCFSQPYSNFYDCTAIGCGKEGFMFNGVLANGEMSSYCRAYRCYASYCNSSIAQGNGAGQAYTMGADHCWWIDCVAEYNFAAGFDSLHYNTLHTDVHHGGAIYCRSNNNGQAFGQAYMNDPGFYNDGGHDMLFYGCVSYNAGVGGQAGRNAANFVSSTEAGSLVPYNVHFVNCLGYNSSYYNMVVTKGAAASTYGNTVVNNTLIKATGGYGGCFNANGATTTKTKVKNNIFIKLSGSYHNLMWISGVTSDKFEMDYNCYYDASKSAIFADGESSPAYTLAQWQSNRGLDANSIQSNPNLVDTTFATLDAHLTVATSPCINAGVNTPWTPPQWVIDADVLANDGAVVGTTRPDGVVDSGTLDMGYHYYAPTPTGNLSSTSVTPASLYISTAGNVVLGFTTANSWDADGKMVVTFPVSLGGGFTFNSGGTTTASFTSGGSGSLAVSVSANVVTLTRSGGSAITGSTALQITLTNIQNPPSVGSSGTFNFKTSTSSDAIIDIDDAVASVDFTTAPQTFKTITITGVSMSNIRFSY